MGPQVADRAQLIAARWAALEDRLIKLENSVVHRRAEGSPAFRGAGAAGSGPAEDAPPTQADPGLDAQISGSREDASAGPLQARLAEELAGRGIEHFSLVRVPQNYYEEDLEFRRRCLGATSVHHLCKSLVMVNTRVPDGQPPETAADDGAHLPKYIAVLVQYTAPLNGDKLNRCVRAMANSSLPAGAPLVSSKMVNMRLCPADVSHELTGFEHNAVSPVGCRTQMPMIMSDRIAKLQPDWFWLGAGESDLKLGLSAAAFVCAYQPKVADIC